MTSVRRTVAFVLACSAAVACGAAAGRRTEASAPGRRYVLVSGRNDHGLLELPAVPLAAAPGRAHPPDTHTHAAVPDGSIVRVIEVRGEWHLVETVGAPTLRGWVDDYRLRGSARLVAAGPSCRLLVGHRVVEPGEPVELLGVAGDHVDVRLERDASVRGLVPSRYIRELPPSSSDDCPPG